jgi:hypothetical protein
LAYLLAYGYAQLVPKNSWDIPGCLVAVQTLGQWNAALNCEAVNALCLDAWVMYSWQYLWGVMPFAGPGTRDAAHAGQGRSRFWLASFLRLPASAFPRPTRKVKKEGSIQPTSSCPSAPPRPVAGQHHPGWQCHTCMATMSVRSLQCNGCMFASLTSQLSKKRRGRELVKQKNYQSLWFLPMLTCASLLPRLCCHSTLKKFLMACFSPCICVFCARVHLLLLAYLHHMLRVP